MNLFRDKEIKMLFIIYLLIMIISTIIIGVVTNVQLRNYKNIVNASIANIVGTISEQYEAVDDLQIINILNSKNNLENGKEILRRYGIKDEDFAIIDTQIKSKQLVITNCALLVVVNLILVGSFILYLKHRQNEIEKLAKYINRLANKQYSLDIEEIEEDELNCLKNELYKITVMLKETADNAKAQKEALSDSVSDISHQLKTPLTSILILLDNLNESENMDLNTKKAFLLEITKKIKDMNFLVISLLQLSRLDAGVIEFSKQKVNLSNVLYEIKNNLEIMIEVKNVNLYIEGTKNAYINGDYNWNKEAIQNIIKNAIEHTKTKVIVNISENDVYTKIEIIDDGQGIDEKDIKHIFERFYKAKNSSENSFGIGLALSKGIIEKQNGYILVESEIGKETKFTIKYMKN